MSRCRSSARCGREAGEGQSFCEDHAEEIAALKARWFSPNGSVLRTPTDGTVPTRIEESAHALALNILRDGGITLGAARKSIGSGADRAIAYAERSGFVRTERQALIPGDVIPPGKLPKEVRAAMLARHLREVGGTISRDDAAAAIGLTPGGLGRVLAFARERGSVRTANGPGGGVTAAG